MRILQINSSRGWSGGQYQVLMLSCGLRDLGHTVVLVCPPGSALAERAVAAGLTVELLEMRGQWDLMAVRLLARLLRSHAIELVNTHKPLPHTLALLAARLAGSPVVVATRRVSFPLRRHPFRRLKWSTGVAGLIAVSQSVNRGLIASGIPADKVHTIYGAIDLKRFSPRPPDVELRRELGLSGDHLIIGKVGDYRSWKGYGVFLDAAAKIAAIHPEARFLAIGGKSDYYGEMVRRVRSLGLEGRVLLTGFRADVERFYSLMQISVNCATEGEGLPGVLRESLAMGVPVIATDVGGSGEVVRDGETGLLIPARDPAALAQAIELLARDPALRARLGKQGQEFVAARFSITAMVGATEALYRRLLATRRPA